MKESPYTFRNIAVVGENGEASENKYVKISNGVFEYIGNNMPSDPGRVIDGKGKALLPGFYNTHTHSPMLLLRGTAEDVPFDTWLNDTILPLEDMLETEDIYPAAMLSIAEMLASGTVSASDTYMFAGEIAKAFIDSGMKANIARPVVDFDGSFDPSTDRRFAEEKALFEEFNGAGNGRLKVDFAYHAVYSATDALIDKTSDYVSKNGMIQQIHLSESRWEVGNCKIRYGASPVGFFASRGVFEMPTLAAHCVHISDEDISVLKDKGVFVASNPASNLKLGNGVCPVNKLLDMGINISVGTDGAASNNSLDIVKEAYLLALLQKGLNETPEKPSAKQIFKMLTVNGALAQGRRGGTVKQGSTADFCVADVERISALPAFDPLETLIYGGSGNNIVMTAVDGVILYENGEYTTIDIEKYRFKLDRSKSRFIKYLKHTKGH